ncbi:MAG: ADP-forming succinate--CoA ligase subunit beta [Candidatus Bathyarchaeia archaeon]
MKLLEYEAKDVFRGFGIPVPRGKVAESAEGAVRAAEMIGGQVVVKAQVPVGGRGKAGGILVAETPERAGEAAARLLASEVRGIKVRRVLVEERLKIEKEFYLGLTVDRRHRTYVILASSEGGVDIEEVASRTPEKIIRQAVDPLEGFRPHHARWVAKRLGFSGGLMMKLSEIATRLYNLGVEADAELAEINPLALVGEGFVAADARLNIDDNALFRHGDLLQRYGEGELEGLSEVEREARRLGLTYVELDGNIGIIGNGAGLTMATLDTVTLYGGKPGNFLDLGGGIPPERVEQAVSLLLNNKKMGVLLVNILGGITRCDEIARGIVNARLKAEVVKPIVVRLSGTNEEEGIRILREAGIEVMGTMEEAAERSVILAGGR